MKIPRILFPLVLVGLACPSLRAQFPDFPAADLVLGATDFTTVGSGSNSVSALSFPTSVAIDPISGKVFVVCLSQHRVLRFSDSAALSNGANAEAVIGQVNFSGASSGAGQGAFSNPVSAHVDRRGRLWVADRLNNRVLMFDGAATLGNGAPADRVLGQPDFVTTTSGTTAAKMNFPVGLFVDANDNLWVADQSNHRVLKFDVSGTPSNGAAATVAIGQPNLTTVTSGLSDVKLNVPSGVAVDSGGRLWVADGNNHRVVRYDGADSLASGAAASAVLGQTDFVTNSSGLSAQKFNNPIGLTVDTRGTLFVFENSNKRVTVFGNAAAKGNGAAADGVIGQPDFVSNATGTTARQFVTSQFAIAVDSSGALWVPDGNNNRVLRFSPDKTRPVLRVTTRVPASVPGALLALKGKATDANGIAEVRFRTGNGAFAKAKGTTSWSAKAKLKKGRNRIEIIATDSVGNDSLTKRITVTRD